MVLFLSLLLACNEGQAPLDTGFGGLPDDADTDTDTDTDTDADTDADVFLEPEYFYVTVYAGVVDGELHDFGTTDGTTYPPMVVAYLFDEAYSEANDPDLMCAMYWTFEGAPVESTEGWLRWEVDYTPWAASEPCAYLDPAIYGADPMDALGVDSGSVQAEPMSDDTRDQLVEWTGDWPAGDEDIFSGRISFGALDERIGVYDEYYPGLQLFYGYAYAVDDDMVSDFTTLTRADEVADGEPGLLVFSSLSYDTSWW